MHARPPLAKTPQHEFAVGEIQILKRSESQLTSRAGYAGGTRLGKDGRVCYHNLSGQDEYGKMGHSEVVGVSIPKSSFKDFCRVYFSLFDKKGDRPDQLGDRGGEYRSVVGVPGGWENRDMVGVLKEVSEEYRGVVSVIQGKVRGEGEANTQRILCRCF